VLFAEALVQMNLRQSGRNGKDWQRERRQEKELEVSLRTEWVKSGKRMQDTSGQFETGKGLVVGLIAGAVGAWVMNQTQALLTEKLTGTARSHGAQSLQQGSPHHGAARELQSGSSDRESDDATMRAAQLISETAFNRKLSGREKNTAGTIAHYAMGATCGAIYGALAETWPEITCGNGLAFGAAVWLAADEAIVPILGLSKASTEYSLKTHGYSLASHLVYGLAVELTRRRLTTLG
jgi:uncharacterized membrane protein YagU involved in acid resistance